MGNKRYLKTVLGLLLALAMAFAPAFSSYAAFAAGPDSDEQPTASITQEDITVEEQQEISVEEQQDVAAEEQQETAGEVQDEPAASETPDAAHSQEAKTEGSDQTVQDVETVPEDAVQPDGPEEAELVPSDTRTEYVWKDKAVRVTATLSDADVYSEIIGCEEAYYNITGKQMDLFFRPPGGNYSRRTMQITKDLGYSSVFWSIAYFDYDQSNQPGVEYVLNHFEQYHHNGAVVLMHNDSSSNRDAMEDVILYLKQQGYRFGSLDELLSKETDANSGE